MSNLGYYSTGLALTAPTVPATTVALKNPFLQDCLVYLTGGTFTVVAINGVTTGFAGNCTLIVEANQTIAITYSAAPSWVWVAL